MNARPDSSRGGGKAGSNHSRDWLVSCLAVRVSEPPIKVLLVEDEPAFADVLQAVLRQVNASGFAVSRAESLRDTLRCLREEHFAVVLLDLSLPDQQGLRTYTEAHAAAPTVPILVLTGLDDETLALQAVREGAQDYLVKGQFDGRTLARVIRYAIERKRTVEELRGALAELKRSHEDLKATQLQLIQAERLQAVSTFAAGVAHEVKNPLQTIILGVDYLANSVAHGDTTAGVVLADMNSAVSRADAIIHGLLEFSATRQRTVVEADLNAITEQSLRAVEHEMVMYPITLERDLAGALPRLRLDVKALRHVFINLFMNSIRSLADGGTLRVKTSARLLRESDLAPGAKRLGPLRAGDEVVAAEIEESLAAAPQEKAPREKGLGVGLTVLKKIIELAGGVIDIRNRLGGGTTITLLFRVQPKSLP